MDIHELSETLRRDAVAVVFANVLLQQLGLPIPAVPTLLVAGSLLAGGAPIAAVLAAAVLASVIADGLWYASGRLFGYRVLSGLCRLSINPASCVSQTEGRFARWGLASLVVAKFVPGFSTVAPPIAGALRMSPAGFVAAAALGALLWAGAAIATGWLLRDEVERALLALERNGTPLAAAVLVLLALWLGWKWWQKFRFERLAAIPHITPAELVEALASANPPLLLDLRGASMVAAGAAVPEAVITDQDRLLEAVRAWPSSAPIVTFCACPRDASAIHAARTLVAHGFTAVRPLRGGYAALQAATAHRAGPPPEPVIADKA